MGRVLLIGGNGFIGSHIQDALLANGLQVSVLDRFPERYRSTLRNVQAFVGHDSDGTIARHAMEGADSVVYLASTTVPQSSSDDPARDVVDNLVPFLRYLDLASHCGVQRFVYFSSGGTVYGVPSTMPVPETHPTQPISAHGVVKLMMEKYLMALVHKHRMGVAILRVGNAYGERQNPFGTFGAIATILGCFASGRPIHIWGSGDTVRDYIYVKDVASACLKALLTDSAHGAFNIGTGQGYSLNQLVRVIGETTMEPIPEIRWEEQRGFDVPHIVLDNTLAKRKLGWEPVTSLSDGVRSTWEWVRTLPLPLEG